MAAPSTLEAVTESLRKRNTPLRTHSKEDARRAVLELNALEEKEVKDDNQRKTFGRTPGGTGTLPTPQCFQNGITKSPI